MPFELQEVLQARRGENFSLQAQYMNPQMGRVLKTIGFDPYYERGEGATSSTPRAGATSTSCPGSACSPSVGAIPRSSGRSTRPWTLDLPNLVQMDCSLLPGLLAEALVHALPTPASSGPSSQHRGRGGRDRPSSSPAPPPSAAPDRLLRPRVPRPHDRRAGAQRGPRVPRRLRPAPARPASVPFGDIDALAPRSCAGATSPPSWSSPSRARACSVAPEDTGRGPGAVPPAQTLLVIDEVQTGLGRTGTFFCHEHWGLEPDLITVSKALSGGYVPVGAVIAWPSLRRASSARWTAPWCTLHLRHEPARHGGRARHVAGLRRRVHRRPRPAHGRGVHQAPRPPRRAARVPPRGAGQGAHDRDRVRQARFARPAAAVDAARDHAHGLFTQLVIVPLFHGHGILTQVAADNINVVKLLPPLIAGEEQADTSSTRSTTCSAPPPRARGCSWRSARPWPGARCAGHRDERARRGRPTRDVPRHDPGRRRPGRGDRRQRLHRLGRGARPAGPRACGGGAGRARRTTRQPRRARRRAHRRRRARRRRRDRAVRGCRAVFHVAALYRFWARRPARSSTTSTWVGP